MKLEELYDRCLKEFNPSRYCMPKIAGSGAAGSGLGDVAYLIAGGLDAAYLDSHETALLSAYFSELRARLPATVPYTFADCARDFEWELLDYAKTALPHLLAGLEPSMLAANARKYGWLTHEYDPRATAWLCRRAIAISQALLPRP